MVHFVFWPVTNTSVNFRNLNLRVPMLTSVTLYFCCMVCAVHAHYVYILGKVHYRLYYAYMVEYFMLRTIRAHLS